MIKYTDINFPKKDAIQKVDIINAIKAVRNYSDVEFEMFILEYLKYVKGLINENSIIDRVGGTGDYGIDLFYKNNTYIEMYQCKQYKSQLLLSDIVEICIKIIFNCFLKKIDTPNKTFIISSNGVQLKALTILEDQNKLKNELKAQYKVYKKRMKFSFDDGDMEKFIDNFDTSMFVRISLEDIVTEYVKSQYCIHRFNVIQFNIPRIIVKEPTYQELAYNKQLLDIFGEPDIVDRANQNYYSALCLKETINYLFGDYVEFDKVKKEINEKVFEINLLENDDKNRYILTLQAATNTGLDACFVSRELKMVDNSDKKGICHFLVNEGELKWKK